MHRAMLASPLRGIGATAFLVLAVVQPLADDTPLNSSRISIVGCYAFLHGPSERAMVNNHILHVLHIQRRIALGGDITGAETDVTDNHIGLGYAELTARNTDTSARSRLTRDGHVRMLQFQFFGQVDSAANTKQHRSRRIIACAECPAERSRHQIVVVTVVQSRHIVHVAATTTCHKLTIAFRTRESRQHLLCLHPNHTAYRHREKNNQSLH